MKILVADDDAVSRLLTQRALERFGYEVVLAEDGRKAAEVLSGDDSPRLALIDWMMPELDGPELCRRIRATHRDSPYVYVILLTSKQSSEDIVAGLEAGADDYLTKPFQIPELRARLHTGRRILSLEDNLVQAREEMRFQATHDGLTALWNRTSIFTLLRGELQRGLRDHKPVSVMLCDVDHFKKVNDDLGHLVGDLVLEEVSRRLRGVVRGYDAVGRYGGEEFLVVLSDCGAANLASRAESVRRAIADAPFLLDARTMSVTLSIGGATCEGAFASPSVEALLGEADAALYQAKAEGRNRTIISTPRSSSGQTDSLQLAVENS